MEYIFILGRNPELSILELESVFGEFGHKKIGNAILADFPEIKKGTINKLGGAIEIGQVVASGKDIEKKIGNLVLYSTSGNKLNYVVWDFSGGNGFLDEAREILKAKFKEERMKTTEKKISNFLKLQSGVEVRNLSSNKLIDEQYFAFDDKFGRIIETCDYEVLEKEDMEKPVRRQELAISPRLAKILVNLSGAKPGETLADPFCGVGSILHEALKREIRVIGIDKDPRAIEGLRKNLEWSRTLPGKYQLINQDSATAQIRKADAVATEPDFGETLRQIPNEEQTKEMLSDYENLMIKVLNNLKTKVSGKFAFTAPFILSKTKGKVKRMGCNSERMTKATGLKISPGFPADEFRRDQIVGRQIFLLKH